MLLKAIVFHMTSKLCKEIPSKITMQLTRLQSPEKHCGLCRRVNIFRIFTSSYYHHRWLSGIDDCLASLEILRLAKLERLDRLSSSVIIIVVSRSVTAKAHELERNGSVRVRCHGWGLTCPNGTYKCERRQRIGRTKDRVGGFCQCSIYNFFPLFRD